MKTKNKIVLGSVLAVFVLMGVTATASAANVVWFEPDPCRITGCGNTSVVDILLNATEGVNGIDIWIEYDPECAHITAATSGSFPLMFLVKYQTGATHIIGASSTLGDITGDRLKLATITIECVDCTGCQTTLDLNVSCKLGSTQGNRAATWRDGTFTCEAPAQPCLGSCCTDASCTDVYEENVACTDCITLGKYWHPNKNLACFNDVEPFDLCLNYCPQCCNGIDDDDTDSAVDFPDDPECTCGLDPSEAEKLPPVPEASSLVLLGVGVLALMVLTGGRMRMRE